MVEATTPNRSRGQVRQQIPSVSHCLVQGMSTSQLLGGGSASSDILRKPLLTVPQRDSKDEIASKALSKISINSRMSKLGSLIARTGKFDRDSGDDEDDPELSGMIIRCSLGVNIILFVAKIYAFLSTGSLAVLASLVDSTIDLLAQGTLMASHAMAHGSSRQASEIYPAGVARVEPLGVVICAVLMVLASVEVVRKSMQTLFQYVGTGTAPPMNFGEDTGALIFVVIILKVALWRWCIWASAKCNNVSLEAIGLDNQNDVLSNTAALISAYIAKFSSSLWWADPVGAILISVYIVWTWIETATEQVKQKQKVVKKLPNRVKC